MYVYIVMCSCIGGSYSQFCLLTYTVCGQIFMVMDFKFFSTTFMNPSKVDKRISYNFFIFIVVIASFLVFSAFCDLPGSRVLHVYCNKTVYFFGILLCNRFEISQYIFVRFDFAYFPKCNKRFVAFQQSSGNSKCQWHATKVSAIK